MFVENRNPLPNDERLDEDIEAMALWILSARDLQSGDPSATEACRAELLSRRLLAARIQDEARWIGADQFLPGCRKFAVPVWNRQIEYAQERAIERKNQIGIAGNAMQLAIGGYEESFCLLQGGQLAIRTIENRKGEWRVVSAATLIGSNGG